MNVLKEAMQGKQINGNAVFAILLAMLLLVTYGLDIDRKVSAVMVMVFLMTYLLLMLTAGVMKRMASAANEKDGTTRPEPQEEPVPEVPVCDYAAPRQREAQPEPVKPVSQPAEGTMTREQWEELADTIRDEAGVARPSVLDPQGSEAVQKQTEPTEEVKSRPETRLKKKTNRVLLGHDMKTNEAVHWEFKTKNPLNPDDFLLANRHAVVLGGTGQGKTFLSNLFALGFARMGVPVISADFSGSFTPSQLEVGLTREARINRHLLSDKPLPIDPFMRLQYGMKEEGRDITLETDYQVAERITGILSQIFSLGAQQRAKVVDEIESNIRLGGYSFRQLVQDLRDDGGTQAVGAMNRIRPLAEANAFGPGGKNNWRGIIESGSDLNVLELDNVTTDAVGAAIVEFLIADLYRYMSLTHDDTDPVVLMLAETQLQRHQKGSAIAKVETEGRKHGMSLIQDTQSFEGFKKDEIIRKQMSSLLVYFNMANDDIDRPAESLMKAHGKDKAYWARQIASLKKGQAIVETYDLTAGKKIARRVAIQDVNNI